MAAEIIVKGRTGLPFGSLNHGDTFKWSNNLYRVIPDTVWGDRIINAVGLNGYFMDIFASNETVQRVNVVSITVEEG